MAFIAFGFSGGPDQQPRSRLQEEMEPWDGGPLPSCELGDVQRSPAGAGGIQTSLTLVLLSARGLGLLVARVS